MTIEEAIKHAEEVAESQEYEGKKLEESGEKYHDEYENYCASQCFECAKEHRQLAEWLKELKQLREQIRWIPVSERLPEDGQRVLVDYCVEDVGIMIIRFNVPWNYGFKAWMPLPQSYKAESEVKNADND